MRARVSSRPELTRPDRTRRMPVLAGQAGKRLGRERRAEEIPLSLVANEAPQDGQLRPGLDALARDPEPERQAARANGCCRGPRRYRRAIAGCSRCSRCSRDRAAGRESWSLPAPWPPCPRNECARVARRDVDRRAERHGEGRGLAAEAGVEHEVAERLDEPAVLGDRDEAVGTDRAALWVLPAYQASTAVSTPSVTPICG